MLFKKADKSAASNTGYRPLPPIAGASATLGFQLPESIRRRVDGLSRLHQAIRRTATPPESPLGRFAAWAHAAPYQYAWRLAMIGATLGLCVVPFAWYNGDIKNLDQFMTALSTALPLGALLGFLVPASILGSLGLAASYWRWVAVYAFVLCAIMGFRAVF